MVPASGVPRISHLPPIIGQTVSLAAGIGVEADAVILDRDVDYVVFTMDSDMDFSRLGMFRGIVNRFFEREE